MHGRPIAALVAASIALAACDATGDPPPAERSDVDSAVAPTETAPPQAGGTGADVLAGEPPRFAGRWAAAETDCEDLPWLFTANSLETPAGSACTFDEVNEVPGGYDIAATCTAEGPPTEEVIELRFAESAGAMLFGSEIIAETGLVACDPSG